MFAEVSLTLHSLNSFIGGRMSTMILVGATYSTTAVHCAHMLLLVLLKAHDRFLDRINNSDPP